MIPVNASVRARLDAGSIPVPDSGCWLWLRATDHQGYGMMKIAGVQHRAQRVSFVAHGGLLADGMIVCHKCDTPSCVNPDHLFAGTHGDNARDRAAKDRGRRPSERTHCRNGHQFLPGTYTLRDVRGHVARVCRECQRATAARGAARKNGAS